MRLRPLPRRRRSRRAAPLLLPALLCAAALCGCHRAAPQEALLPERGYLWQRDWTPAVANGFLEAEKRMDGVVVLGGEVSLAGTVHAKIYWGLLHGRRVGLALRVAPYFGRVTADDAMGHAVGAAMRQLMDEAGAHHVTPSEVQLDFDCPQSKLEGYRDWVRMARGIVSPAPLVITALPAWLAEPAFPALAREADGYVLQVHSVPTQQETGRALLCDPALARKWVAEASRIGIPFSVSLPAYWCLAGYDGSGRLLGVAMDSVQPAWPAGTGMLEFSADADDIAGLVSEWRRKRPRGMQGILWYRIPVATDVRNWRWPTLAAVMAGRAPLHHVEAVCEGDNPVDVSLVNSGEAEERGPRTVTLTWSGARAAAWDALPGWSVAVGEGSAVFSTIPGAGLRLSPADRRSIGWIRYDKVVAPQWQVDAR
jgi:hypothetical protein